MAAYPVLRLDQFSNPHLPGTEHWQSAMTYKFVGALKGITAAQPQVMKALMFGVVLGLAIEIARKLLKASGAYQSFTRVSRTGRITGFVVDAVIIPSPYASSFGGFVEIPTILWWTAGGAIGTFYNFLEERRHAARNGSGDDALPSDMSTTSLVGGGLIAGDSLAALTLGILGLLTALVKK